MRKMAVWGIVIAICMTGILVPGAARSCVSCGGGPGEPQCITGTSSGGVTCTVTQYSCTQTGTCGGTGCFLPGTLVQTPGGPCALEEVQVGDLVLGVDDNGNHVFNEVVDTIRAVAHNYYVINNSIEVTGMHPFFVGQHWIPADELRIGDSLVCADGTAVLVESITTVEWGVRTFNLSVAGNHTFFADGVLVHNKEKDPNDD